MNYIWGNEMKDSYDVIIIGSGMGGLTSAAWLTHMGMMSAGC